MKSELVFNLRSEFHDLSREGRGQDVLVMQREEVPVRLHAGSEPLAEV